MDLEILKKRPKRTTPVKTEVVLNIAKKSEILEVGPVRPQNPDFGTLDITCNFLGKLDWRFIEMVIAGLSADKSIICIFIPVHFTETLYKEFNTGYDSSDNLPAKIRPQCLYIKGIRIQIWEKDFIRFELKLSKKFNFDIVKSPTYYGYV